MVLKLFLWAHPVSQASTSLVSKKIEQEPKEYSMLSHPNIKKFYDRYMYYSLNVYSKFI